MHRVHGLAGGRDGYGRDGYGHDENWSLIPMKLSNSSFQPVDDNFPGMPHSITKYVDGFEPSTAQCRASDSFKVKLQKQERGFGDFGKRNTNPLSRIGRTTTRRPGRCTRAAGDPLFQGVLESSFRHRLHAAMHAATM